MQFAVAADTRGAVASLMRAAGVREVPHAFLLDTQVGRPGVAFVWVLLQAGYVARVDTCATTAACRGPWC